MAECKRDGVARRLAGLFASVAAMALVAPGLAAAAQQAAGGPQQEEASISQVGETSPAGTADVEASALEEAAGQVEQRDLQVDGPTLGPGVRISAPFWTDGGQAGSRGGGDGVSGIPIPSNARMPGEVRYIEVPVPVLVDDDFSYRDDPLFIRGFVTELHGPDRGRRDRDRRRRGVSEPIRGGLVPADEVFRGAQLRFSEAATVGSSGTRRSDDAFRRAQLRFHEASTRPHVGDDAGVRRESERARPRRDGDRARERRGGERRERPRRVGEGAVAPE